MRAVALVALYTVALAIQGKAEDNVLKIGTEAQLFVDGFVIESMTGLRRVVNQPAKHPLNPVIRGDNPWEVGVLSSPTVAYDPQARVFHMWYHATSAPPATWGEQSFCYARSRDGVRWEKPRLGLVEFNGSNQNNIIGRERPLWVTFAGQPADAQKKFFAFFGGAAPMSVGAYWSADGLRWEKESETGDLRSAPETPTGPNPRYIHTGQCWAGRNAWGAGRRGAMRVETSDLKHWGGRRTIFQAGPDDPENLEFYSMTPHDRRVGSAYHGLYLGFLQCFHTDLAGKRNPANKVAMSGPIDVELAVSRDTVSWQRAVAGMPFLPVGPQGAFDSGMVFLHSMVEKDDRLYFYYAGYDLDHGDLIGTPAKIGHAQIGLAILERDRLVSLEPEHEQGTLTTRPIKLEGARLLVNADAKGGRLTVRVLDADGAPLAPESRPISTDSLRHHVAWRGANPLTPHNGRAVRLEFILRKPARLYSFQVAGQRDQPATRP